MGQLQWMLELHDGNQREPCTDSLSGTTCWRMPGVQPIHARGGQFHVEQRNMEEEKVWQWKTQEFLQIGREKGGCWGV